MAARMQQWPGKAKRLKTKRLLFSQFSTTTHTDTKREYFAPLGVQFKKETEKTLPSS